MLLTMKKTRFKKKCDLSLRSQRKVFTGQLNEPHKGLEVKDKIDKLCAISEEFQENRVAGS